MNTDRKLTDDDMLEKLLCSLPKDAIWVTARHWCIRDRYDFEQTVVFQQSVEKEQLTSTTPSTVLSMTIPTAVKYQVAGSQGLCTDYAMIPGGRFAEKDHRCPTLDLQCHCKKIEHWCGTHLI